MRKLILLTILAAAAAVNGQEHNVQYLTNLTPTQLQRTMNMMSASLGVSCDACHVRKDDHFDWASDEKQEKKTARSMIAMTINLNEKFFNNRPAVSCNSCHRGSEHPVNLITLPQTVPVPEPDRPTTRPAMPTRDEIVAKYTAAIGNIDAAALSSLVAKGTRDSRTGSKSDIVVTQKGGTMKVESGEFTTVITPTGGWSAEKGKAPRDLSANQLEHSTELNRAMMIVAPESIPADARVVRKDKIDGRDVYVVQSAAGPNVRQRLYFDAENSLLLRRLLLTATPIGEIPMQVDYSDYRQVGKAKLPFTVSLDAADPRIGATRHFTEIRTGATVDEKVFEKPAS